MVESKVAGAPQHSRLARWARRCALTVVLLVIVWWAHGRFLGVMEALPPAPGKLVDVGGRRMHVQCAGTGSPTVILEAGGSHDSTQYARVHSQVAAFTRVCSYDRAGMGHSDPSDVPRSARALADDLAALVERVPMSAPLILVAGSAGGLTVDLFAREHPHEVAGMVLLDAVSDELLSRTPAEGERMQRRACTMRALAHLGVLKWLDPLHRRREHAADEAERAVRLTYRRAPWDAICSLVEQRQASLAQLRAAPPLRVDMPVVALVRDSARPHGDGVSEAAWRSIQRTVVARSTRGTLIVAERSGHHVATDRPDLVVSAIRHMVDEQRAARR